MALTAEEKSYALQIVLKYMSFSPKSIPDADKFFVFFEADEETKKKMISDYIKLELLPYRQGVLQTYNDLATKEQAYIDELSAKANP
jgi:hypothetical protein